MLSVIEKLAEQIEARFSELEAQMSDPEVLADGARLQNIARERGGIAKLATRMIRNLHHP